MANIYGTFMREQAEARIARLERDLAAARRQKERLREERDAAFAMSKCECGPDECCANLVRLHRDLAAAREALQKIAAIENKMYGPDWDEIQEARVIAINALAAAPATSDAEDAARLEWATHNPEAAMRAIQSDWSTAGRGLREKWFNFRGAIDAARGEKCWSFGRKDSSH